LEVEKKQRNDEVSTLGGQEKLDLERRSRNATSYFNRSLPHADPRPLTKRVTPVPPPGIRENYIISASRLVELSRPIIRPDF
jgi:hypothetical protein